jgi:hypothetical protein
MLRRFSMLVALTAIISLAPTAAVSRSAPKLPVPPACSGLSPTAMAKVIGLHTLTFHARTPHTNLCTWEGSRGASHYRALLMINIVPGIKSIYETALGDAEKKHGFGMLTTLSGPWKAAFFVTQTTSGGNLDPCSPEHKLPTFGPPRCSTDPEWTTFAVDSYGTSSYYHQSLMISISLGAQHGDSQLSHIIALNGQVLSGKIH